MARKKSKKSYSQRCEQLSREYDLPYEIVLAIQPNGTNCHKFIVAVMEASLMSPIYRDYYVDDLYSENLNTQKETLKNILGIELSKKINLDSFGPKNVQRIANYIISKLT